MRSVTHAKNIKLPKRPPTQMSVEKTFSLTFTLGNAYKLTIVRREIRIIS